MVKFFRSFAALMSGQSVAGISVLATLSLSLLPRQLHAADFWSVQKQDCSADWGIVVGVDAEQLSVLTLDGRLANTKRSDVHRLSRYRSNEIPLTRFQAAGFEAHLRRVDLESGVSFAGYAYAFSEESALFLDNKARTRVVDINDIRAIRLAGDEPNVAFKNSQAVRILNPADAACPARYFGDSKAPIQAPVQIYDSKMKIETQLEGMEAGYRTLEGLKERINFYPKPMLFDKRTRLGLFSVMGDKVDFPIKMQENTFYLTTGSGESYKFQSHMIFGAQRFQHLPTTDVVFGFESQFKSHLIHGSLTGNLSALRAGDHVYRSAFKEAGLDHPWLLQSFNHETLLGVDLWGWFLDTGYYFPVFAYGYGKELREMTVVNPSQIVSLGWQNARFKVQFFAYRTSSKAQSNPMESLYYVNDDQEEPTASINYISAAEVPSSIRAVAKHFRLNLKYSDGDALTVGGSLLLADVKIYEEGFALVNPGFGSTLGDSYKYRYTSSNKEATAFVHYDIGQYIALTAESLYSIGKVRMSGTVNPSSHKTDSVRYTLGVEFIL